jgi:molybdenum cofactor cytidylyltransferase
VRVFRSFGIVPAAGQSVRMGRPKLLLPWGGRPLVGQTLAAWQASLVERVVVVVRPDDKALAEVVRSCGVEPLVPPTPPPDMKASVQAALRWLADRCQPAPEDAFLVAPADMPRLSSQVINCVLAAYAALDRPQIVVPTLQGRRGHPVLFPWLLAAEVEALPPGEGLRTLCQQHALHCVACDDKVAAGDDPFLDLDTPQDYARWSDRAGRED